MIRNKQIHGSYGSFELVHIILPDNLVINFAQRMFSIVSRHDDNDFFFFKHPIFVGRLFNVPLNLWWKVRLSKGADPRLFFQNASDISVRISDSS